MTNEMVAATAPTRSKYFIQTAKTIMIEINSVAVPKVIVFV
jgi:hypothetical protein